MARMAFSNRRSFRALRTSALLSSFLIGAALLPCSPDAMAYTESTTVTQAQGIPVLPAFDANRTSVIKSPNDPAEYRAVTLPNGLQALLVHDTRADKASASMDVNVGSAANPEDVQGLAHFLEHMLFLGTERYPQPDEYQKYISEHGGSNNAFTADRNTNYYFDIAPNALHDALDRFSQFFIAPQFNADYVDRERHAVHAEYQARLQDDGRRLNDALSQILNPAHPFHKFSVGSLDTLQDGKNGKLRDRLIDFYQKHYDANTMRLVVMGPQSLDQLDQWVRGSFSAIPNRHLTPPTIDVEQVRNDQLPATLAVKSLADERTVTFMFPVPDPERFSREKPSYLISALLGDEGPHSLLARLREKGWAQKLSAGAMNEDGTRALMGVSIELTPEGTHHLDEIQSSLFTYVKQLREDIAQWRFDEQSLLLRQQFRFQQTNASAERAQFLAATLTHHPISEVSVESYRMDHFDAELLKQYLDAFTPEHLLRVYTAPNVEADQTSPYFKAPYRYQKISQWPQATPLSDIRPPQPNPYIAQDFTLLPLKDSKPSALIQRDGLDIWYAPNQSFGTPSVVWRLSLMSPLSQQSVKVQLLTDLLADWLNDSLAEPLYPATLAGQSGSAYSHLRGITVYLSGWRDHQANVMKTLLDQLRDGQITEESFNRIKMYYQESLRNARQRPLSSQVVSLPAKQLFKPYWSPKLRRDTLDTLTRDDLEQFRKAWLTQLHVQGLAVGNIDAQQVRQQAERVEQQLAPQQKLNNVLMPEPLKLTNHLPTLRPETDRNDSAALLYVQGKNQSIAQQARFAVLAQLIEAPFFTQLRTQEQLGYVVTAHYNGLLEAPGLNFFVQSPNHDSKTLFSRIDAWQKGFDSVVRQLDNKALAPYKAAVLTILKERDQSLGVRASRYWTDLSTGYTRFDRRDRIVKAIESLNASDIQRTWQTIRKAPTLKVAADPNVPATDIDISTHLSPVPTR